MSVRAVTILLAFASSACAPTWTTPKHNGSTSAPTTRYVCLDLPDSTRDAVSDAVATWSRALQNWRRLEVSSPDEGGCSYWIGEVNEPPPELPWALAFANLGGDRISMVRGRYERYARKIALHEIGHLLGAQHIQGTLMQASYDPGGYHCPDLITVAQVAAWNHVNLEMLSYCY